MGFINRFFKHFDEQVEGSSKSNEGQYYGNTYQPENMEDVLKNINLSIEEKRTKVQELQKNKRLAQLENWKFKKVCQECVDTLILDNVWKKYTIRLFNKIVGKTLFVNYLSFQEIFKFVEDKKELIDFLIRIENKTKSEEIINFRLTYQDIHQILRLVHHRKITLNQAEEILDKLINIEPSGITSVNNYGTIFVSNRNINAFSEIIDLVIEKKIKTKYFIEIINEFNFKIEHAYEYLNLIFVVYSCGKITEEDVKIFVLKTCDNINKIYNDIKEQDNSHLNIITYAKLKENYNQIKYYNHILNYNISNKYLANFHKYVLPIFQKKISLATMSLDDAIKISDTILDIIEKNNLSEDRLRHLRVEVNQLLSNSRNNDGNFDHDKISQNFILNYNYSK
jgi:hypothetical protein